MEIVVNSPRTPTKVRVMRMKNAEREAVKVGHVVVDPLLPRLIIGAKVRRQPLHGVQEARRADLGVLRGVAHRSARR
eukprot:scaffold12304_cov121-Isochrysis_galbana.AAC.6